MGSDPVDVLVIGAGVSGGVVAKRLVEAGLSVLCLEQGQWPDRADYPGSSPEWKLRAAKQWSSSPGVRNGPADYPIDVTASEFGVLNFNGVGGGSILYNAQWPRMLPEVFAVGSRDGVADDWPIGYSDLQSYYEATDLDFGVSGLGGNPMYPPGAEPGLPPLPIGEIGLRVARAHARLGSHWWPGTNAILSAGRDGRKPCVQRGSCGSGCNEGAKASADITHWRSVVRLGGRVVTGARVTRILVDGRGLACGAEWVDTEGRGHNQHADLVVCAANGIGTPRLLLASSNSTHPDGLANASGLVGRNLMLHPLVSVAGVFDEMRYQIGVDRIMWGNDFPHIEGTYPYTMEAIRFVFADVPEAEIRAMLAGKAAEVYRFDLDALRPIVDRVGPTIDEIITPLDEVPQGSMSSVFIPAVAERKRAAYAARAR